MAKIDPNFTHDVFRFLPSNVRTLDTAGTLERFLGGVQQVFESQQAKIGELDTLHDLDAIDDEFLTYLKHHVGWTAELDAITEALSFDQLRKLIELSVPFWKRKGTEPGIRDALRLLTGRDVVIRNWFFYRWTVGVTALWRLGDERDPYLTGGEFGARDQLLSIVFVSTETDVDKQLVRDLVNLHRPLQEAVKVMYVDLVDDFGISRDKWTTMSGTDITYDSTRKLISIPAGTTILANTASVSTWDETVWRNTMTFTGATGGEFVILFRRDTITSDRYRARFLQDGTVELAEVISGTPAILDTGSIGHILPQGETVTFGIDLYKTCHGELRIDIRVYNEIVATTTLVEPNILDPAQWRVRNSGADPIEMDNVVGYDLPVHVDTITGPGIVDALPPTPVAAPCIVIETTDFSGWTTASQWHTSTHRFVAGALSMYYGTGETGYFTWGTSGAMGPAIVTGNAFSPNFDMSPYPVADYDAFFEFWVYMDLRVSLSDDLFEAEILVSGVPVFTFTPTAVQKSTPGWVKYRSSNLASVIGASASVRIRFTMDTVTAPDPTREGVFIDQVRMLVQES